MALQWTNIITAIISSLATSAVIYLADSSRDALDNRDREIVAEKIASDEAFRNLLFDKMAKSPDFKGKKGDKGERGPQ